MQNEESSVLIVKQSKVMLVEVLLLVDKPQNHVIWLMAIEPQKVIRFQIYYKRTIKKKVGH